MIDIDNQIKACCKELRIGMNIYENYPKIEAESHSEFLLKLLELEVENREITRKNRNLRSAGFDLIKTFDTYEFKDIEMPKSITTESIKKCEFINKKENLIFYGSVGTGKTHLATAIGVAACSMGKKVKFCRTAALVNELVEANASGSLKKLLKQIEKTDLLICDEWGYVPFEKSGSQLLFQVILECYERRSIILTTNLEFSRWNGIFYDEKLTSALIDRLVHHSHLLVFNGPSYRVTHSTMNQN